MSYRDIKETDVKIAKNLWVSAHCVYSKRKKRNARDVCRVVYQSLDAFRKYLDFPEDVTVRVCSIKGTVNGRYIDGAKLVEIHCSLTKENALEVLAHELIHAEQYHTGRLKNKFSSKKGWIHTWHGSKNYSKGTTYQAYRKQPWEEEAWGRQAELAKLVRNDLKEKNVQI